MTGAVRQRSVLGATAAVWAGQAGAQAATAALFAVLARYADPAEFGRTAVGYGLLLVYAQLADCGAQQRLLRDAALAEPGPGRLRSLVAGRLALTAVLAPVLAAALLHFTGSWAAAAAGVGYAAVRAVTLLALALEQARGRAPRAAGITVAERVAAAAAGWALAAAGAGAPTAVALGLLAGGLVALLPAATAITPLSGRGSLRDGVAYGRHWAPVSLAATLVLLDTVLVGAVAGDAEAGHYGMGSRLLGPLVVLTAALCTTLVPAVARGAGVRRAFFVVTATTLVLIAAVVAAAPLLVRLAAGPGYEGAVPAIRVYAVVAGLAAVAQPVVAWLQARGDERWVGRVLPAGIVAGLTGTGIGAALGGAVGGAAGQVAVSAGLCVLLAARFRAVRERRA